MPLYLLFVAFGVVAHGPWPADGLPFWTPVSFAWRVADTPVINHPTIQLALGWLNPSGSTPPETTSGQLPFPTCSTSKVFRGLETSAFLRPD